MPRCGRPSRATTGRHWWHPWCWPWCPTPTSSAQGSAGLRGRRRLVRPRASAPLFLTAKGGISDPTPEEVRAGLATLSNLGGMTHPPVGNSSMGGGAAVGLGVAAAAVVVVFVAVVVVVVVVVWYVCARVCCVFMVNIAEGGSELN